LAATQFGGGVQKSSVGLPKTSDYHSLLVSPSDARQLLLGTHQGLYESRDGGLTWRFAALAANDAMNLARPNAQTIWLAGHNVFKKSVDGGASWQDVRPSGLPSLDIHGFTVDRANPRKLYAAVAGRGLYRSSDGGRSFTLASSEVGGNVMALAITASKHLLAGDTQRGLLESHDQGRSWTSALQVPVLGLAINPRQPNRILATGRGIALSGDGGTSWRDVLDLPEGAGPVAWAPSATKIAYAVGFNRILYRSADGGTSWKAVK
jgi:photosystem II stability/assembly factor-like uncharacterized protein